MAKDRSFAAKMSKKDKEEEIPTALVIKPVKSEDGHYKFKRILTKMTNENPLYHAGMYRSTAYLRYVITLLMLPISAPYAHATDGAGTTSFSFIKIIPGARQAAIGGAFSAVDGDVNALYWNPAALARLTTEQVTVTYTNYFQDVQFGFVGYARPLGTRQVVGIGVQYLSFGTFREGVHTYAM